MTDTQARHRWWIPVFVLVAGFVIAGTAYWQWSQPPAAAPPAPPAPSTGSAPAFTRWAQFEPDQGNLRARLAQSYVDTFLGHQIFRVPPAGLPPRFGRQLMLDDDELLLSSGRRLWSREMLYQPGFAGKFCYLHSSYCLKRLFDVTFFVDGRPVVIYDNQYAVERFPSHTTVEYQLPEVLIDEHKFITADDRAVATYVIGSNDKQAHEVTIEVVAPNPPIPNSGGPASFPMLARGAIQNIPLYLYLDAPEFDRIDSRTVHLRRTLTVPAEGKGPYARATVALRFDNTERATPAAPLASDPLVAHTDEYNRWFAENVPYFDSSDAAFKKMWYYRWWIVRFHIVEGDTSDLKDYAFYEGKLGFDNVIGFAVPAQLKELTYLRDPRYGLAQAQNGYRNHAENGAVVDAPGSPYWGETYSHWIGMALAEFNRVHPIPPARIRALLPAMALDVRGWMKAYDADDDTLPEREMPRVTGYDLDILSYWFFNGNKLDLRAEPPPLERVDFASFVYGNAAGIAELAQGVGDTATAQEFTELAERIRAAVLANLWDDRSQFFYPRVATDHTRVPIRELHGFFPFTTQLAPNEPRYTAALAKFVDPTEFWARFPPVITSLAHYRDWNWEQDGLTRNIAPHPISMGARTLIQVLKHYRQDAVTPAHFMELMARYNTLVYPGVHPRDPLWRPNVHEYYSKWEPHSNTPRPKPSDISHDFHSMYCSLIVEGAVGLTPRTDAKIELQPLAQQWTYFMLDRLRYRDHDLTIVWDQPDGRVRYPGYPEGFSLYLDGELAFTRPGLGHVVYDPMTKATETAD